MPDTPRKGSMLVIFLTVFIDLLGFGMVLPLLPVYAHDFGRTLEPHMLGWVIGTLMASFSAMQLLFAPFWGRLSDRIGRRPVLMIGLAGSVVFYTMFGIATVMKSLTWLFVARIGAGIAGATISTAHAYIADTTTSETRARGMALVGMAFGLGFTFGPLFGFLALLRSATEPGPGPGYAAAALSLVALLLAWFLLPESLDPQRVDPERRAFGPQSLLRTLEAPTVGMLVLTMFIAVLSFANFESTLSLFVKNEQGAFAFTFPQLLLTFAYVGFVLALVQGGVVRRLAGRVAEVKLAGGGILLEVAGLAMLAQAHAAGSVALLMAALGVVTAGFAFITPSLNALISRRSDPSRQGEVMGVTQSASAMARIFGPFIGAQLFFNIGPTVPLWTAALLMAASLLTLLLAAGGGRDYVAQTS